MPHLYVSCIGPELLVCSIARSPYASLERAISELTGISPVTLAELERLRLADPPLEVRPCTLIDSSSRTVTLSVGRAIEI